MGECRVPQSFCHKDPGCPVPARKAAAMRRSPLVKEEITLSPFLTLLNPEKLSLIIVIMEMMNLHRSGGVSDGMKTSRALLTSGGRLRWSTRQRCARTAS